VGRGREVEGRGGRGREVEGRGGRGWGGGGGGGGGSGPQQSARELRERRQSRQVTLGRTRHIAPWQGLMCHNNAVLPRALACLLREA